MGCSNSSEAAPCPHERSKLTNQQDLNNLCSSAPPLAASGGGTFLDDGSNTTSDTTSFDITDVALLPCCPQDSTIVTPSPFDECSQELPNQQQLGRGRSGSSVADPAGSQCHPNGDHHREHMLILSNTAAKDIRRPSEESLMTSSCPPPLTRNSTAEYIDNDDDQSVARTQEGANIQLAETTNSSASFSSSASSSVDLPTPRSVVPMMLTCEEDRFMRGYDDPSYNSCILSDGDSLVDSFADSDTTTDMMMAPFYHRGKDLSLLVVASEQISGSPHHHPLLPPL